MKEQLHCESCGKHFEIEKTDAYVKHFDPPRDAGNIAIHFSVPGEGQGLWQPVCLQCGARAMRAAMDPVVQIFILEMLGWLCRVTGDMKEMIDRARERAPK